MERSWRQVSALLVLLALFAAACSSDPSEVVVGDDTSGDVGEEVEDTTDDAMEEVADVASDSVADDSSPFETGPLSNEQSNTLLAIEAAQALWERNGIQDYDFTLVNEVWSAQEVGPIAPSYQIEVRSKAVVRVLPNDDFAFELDDFSIDMLFEELPEAVLSEANFIVEFDNTFGVPTLISSTADNEEMVLGIENFRVAGDYPNECSTVGREADIDWSAPETAVEDTRQGILRALATCDFFALSHLARLGELPLLTDFGGSGVELIWEAESSGESLMSTLFDLLEGKPSTVDGITSWPAEFTDPNSEYLGWRVGISDEGEWLYFVAGD